MELRDKSVLDLYINGEPAVDSLKKLDTEIEALKKQQKELKKQLDMDDLDPEARTKLIQEYREVSDKIKDTTQAKQMLRREMDMEELSIKELQKLLKDYKNEWLAATDPAIREAMRGKMDDVNDRLKELGVNVKSQETVWGNFKGWLAAAFTADGIIELARAVFDWGRESLKMAVEVSDSFADIKKATGMTTAEVEGLNEEMSKIDTRTTQQALLDISKVGGQVGIAKDEMLGFVEATDKAVVALGDEFSGGAEEVASTMGTLKNLFEDTKNLDAGTAINKIGSAVNELGAAGSATGPVMADFAMRMGQLGQLSPQIDQTLGLGAAFQELGLTAEIAAGGLSNILLGAAKATDLFAHHLGMTEAAFKDLINTNPNEVILKLAESFRGLPTDVVVKQLDNLGIKSQEATKVMSLLSDQTGIVREKQQLANKAMDEATSLTNEFNIKNNTAAAQVEKNEKAIAALQLEMGMRLLPVFLTVTQAAVAFVKGIAAIPEFIAENKEMFIALGVAVLSFNSHLIAATAASIAHAAAEKGRLVWTESATVAQLAMNTALTANPIGAVVAALVLLVGGLVTLWKNSETVRGIVLGLWEALKVGVEIAQEVAAKIWKGIQELIDKFPALTNTVQLVWNGIKAAFQSAIDIMGAVGSKIGDLVTFFGNLYTSISSVGTSVSSSLQPAFDFISSGFSSVKESVNAFLNVIGGVASKVVAALRAIMPESFGEVVNIFSGAGKRISQAFNSAFGDEQARGHKDQTAADEANNAKKVDGKKKTAAEIAAEEATNTKKIIATDATANDDHRATEQKKALEAAKKKAEEKIKAEKEAIKAIEDASIKAIVDDQERELAKLELSLKRELDRVEQSKASTATKTAWEKALNEQYERDVAKVQKDYRDKHLADNEELSKRILKLNSDRIALELETKLKQLQNELDAELLKNAKGTEDAATKAAKETELRQKHTEDVTALETKYRALYLSENKTLSDQILDLKTIQIDTELQKKITQLETELTAELKKNKDSKADAALKAEYETELRQRYKQTIEQLEADYRAKFLAEEKKRLDEIKKLEDDQREKLHAMEREAMKTTLETKLKDETLNLNQRKDLKLQLIKLEHAAEMDKIKAIADKEKAEAQATSDKLMSLAKDDSSKKKQIADDLDQTVRAIDAKMIADKTAADAKYLDEKKKAELENIQARKEANQEFFDALKGLMNGDFQGFIGFLNNKFKNEKAMNDARLQNWTSKGEQILEVVDMGLQLMQKLEKAKLEKQLANIAQEKNAQLSSWKEQYDKGLISKDQFEKKTAEINAAAAEKEKQEKLKAWKREQQMQIAMAVVHAAMAALKSLATMGWPLGLIGVAAAAVMAGVQIAQIKRQQPPSFAKGTLIRNAGIPDGPRHGSSYGKGGIGLVRRDTQEEIGEMEGGEPIMILSRNTYKNNRKTVDALLHSSLHRNGAPIYAAKGAMFLEGGFADDSVAKPYETSSSDENAFNPNYGDSGNSGGGYDSGGGSDPSYDSSGGDYNPGSDGTDSPEYSSATQSTQLTDEQIKQSQALMEAIRDNTKSTMLEIGRTGMETKDSFDNGFARLYESLNQGVSKLDESLGKVIGVLTEQVGVQKDIATTSRTTSEKNLTISVTNITDIQNNINVMIDKSQFK